MERKRVGVGLGGPNTQPITSVRGSESKAPGAVTIFHFMWLRTANTPFVNARLEGKEGCPRLASAL